MIVKFDQNHDYQGAENLGMKLWFLKNRTPKIKLTSYTEFFISRAENWQKRMVNPKEPN